MRAILSTALFLSLLTRWVAAEPPAEVVDLNTTNEQETGSYFLGEPFSSLGGDLYFTFNDGIHGIELWKTEGTVGGAVLLKDICPGACGGFPRALTRSGGRIFFFADDGEHGRELWATDGTEAGTSLVKDIWPGLGSGADRFWMLDAGGTVFFPGNDGLHGHELWKSDGTAAGTVLVKDVRPGPEGSLPVPHEVSGGMVLFDAEDGLHGREPWLTDGTALGTRLLKDIRPGTEDSTKDPFSYDVELSWLATSGGRFLFQADDGTQGAELWISDGTEAGTSLVQDINPGATGGQPSELTELAGIVYFSARTDALGSELWRTDGTPVGTSLVRDISPGTGGSSPWDLTVLGERLFFRASDEVHGAELWISDGTEAGTMLVKDIATSFLGMPLFLTTFAGQLYFIADDGTNGEALWKSDGTEAGTMMVVKLIGQTFLPPPYAVSKIHVAGDRLYFDQLDLDLEIDLWASDGTAAGTVLVEEAQSLTSSIWVSPQTGTGPEPGALGVLGVLGDKLIFPADDGTSGIEPWVTDGTAAGTERLAETSSGIAWSNIRDVTPLDGSALFAAGFSENTLWKTDGTPDGTASLLVGESEDLFELTRVGAAVYFARSSTAAGRELWKTDGTVKGTELVKDLLPGAPGSSPFRLTGVASRLFFVANGGPGDRNRELWTSDGTTAGTILVQDIRPGAEPSEIDHLTAVGNRLFLTANDGISGREPWVSDGTAAGTFRIKDIVPGAGSSVAPTPIEGQVTAALGSTFFFLANDGSGEELWRSDGTEDGTRRVKDIRPGSRGSEPRWLTVAGGRLFFSADDGIHGRELWLSNGTEAGTLLVSDILPGAGSSLPREIAAAGNAVAFSATDGVHGVEPWASDGVWTRLLGDIAPGPRPSSPISFTSAGGNTGKVYFAANDGTSGFELWSAVVESPLDLYTVSPCRVVDTRPAAPLLTGQKRTFPIAGSCGVPPEARAVAVTFTAISANGPGRLAAWKTGTPKPETSVLNYPSGVTRSSNGILELGAAGTVDVQGHTFAENGQVHFVLDVTGYFR